MGGPGHWAASTPVRPVGAWHCDPVSGHLRVNCARRERNVVKKTRPFVQLGGNGELVPINFAAFCKLIDGAICGGQVVSCDEVWRREYFTSAFDPPRRLDAWQAGAQAATTIR
jgi:hypothetical protein